MWHRDLGGSGDDGTSNVTDNGKGGIIISAATNSQDGDITHILSLHDMYWAINMDSNSNIIWDNCYGGGGGYCYPNTICRAFDGSVWMAGISSHIGGGVDTAYGGQDAWILHTDSVGNFINAKVLGGTLQDGANIIYPLSNGNIIAIGDYPINNGSLSSLNYYGSIDIFLAIFSPFTTQVSQPQNTTNDFFIYPNPAFDQTTIEIPSKGNYAIEIFNMIGNCIYKSDITYKKKIDINGWKKGVYNVQIFFDNGYRIVKKMYVLE